MKTNYNMITVELTKKEYDNLQHNPAKMVKAFGGNWFAKSISCTGGSSPVYSAEYVQAPLSPIKFDFDIGKGIL